jgi:dTMP kinase
MAGKLIVIEGLDGSGKATQAERLYRLMLENGAPALKVSFPDYESDSSAPVRMYLAGSIGSAGEVNAYAASSFYAVDRYISFQNGWKKNWLAGDTVIADRYTTSNAVHQMAKLPRGDWEGYLAWLWEYEFTKLGLPEPDRVIYLDMEPEFSRRLLLERYGGDESRADIHERDFAYQQSCHKAALFAAGKLGWDIIPCVEAGRLLPVEAMARKIQLTVES